MTIGEFLDTLESTQGQFEWSLEPARNSPERRRDTRFQVRARLTDSTKSSVSLDPLRAVGYVCTGRIFPSGAWSDVADALRLEPSVASVILSASNDRVWTGKGKSRAPVEHLRTIRARILAAVGLEEPPLRNTA